MKYTTVLFDLDGTLINSLDDIHDSLNHIITAHGYPKRSMDQVRAAVGNGASYLIAQSIPLGEAAPDFDTIVSEYIPYLQEHNLIKTAPYEGVWELVKYLAEHEYKLAVVSNKPDKTTKIIVRQFFGDYISVVIGESPKIHRKPAPDTVNAAIGELFSEPWECVYIGDSEVDVETAKAAGMDCISVSWGFRTREQLIKAGATNIAATPEEVKKLL